MNHAPILACATTYEPTELQLDRTVRQLRTLSPVCAIFDNTQTSEVASAIRDKCEANGISYLSAVENVGIARALNDFCRHALVGGQTWLLYLDQDSVIDSQFVELAQSSITAAGSDRPVALIGSRLVLRTHQGAQGATSGRFVKTRYVIASGTAINVKAVESVDGFDEGMRLDVVDIEMCLRLRIAGWSLVIDTGRALRHEIGEDARLVARGLNVSRHPLWRRRLMWRNSVVLARRYSRDEPAEIAKHLMARVLETVSGAVIYREWRLLTTCVQGILDGCRDATRRGLGVQAAEPRP